MTAQAWLQIALTLLIAFLISVPAGRYLGRVFMDRKTIVDARASIDWTRRLAEAGVFAGLSTGAAMAGAAKCASVIGRGTIVVLSADSGWKYLSTGAWTDDIEVVTDRARHTIYF